MRCFHCVAFVLLLSLTACKKSPTAPSGGSGGSGGGSGGVTLPNGSMSARIDGTTWNASVAISVINTPPVGLQLGILSISAGDAVRSVGFATTSGVGTYTIPGNSGTSFLVTQSSQLWQAQVGVAGSGGTVTLTALTANRATGTFSFTAPPAPGTSATGTKVVTDGAFNVTF